MKKSERKSLDRLKSQLVSRLKERYPEVPEDISAWKSKEIAKFQEDLLERVNGRISEKWFYTHIKSNHHTLPRIDILDLLSQYVGYKGWDQFIGNKTGQTKPVQWLFLLLIPLVVVLIVGLYYSGNGSHQFCFVDTYSKQIIPAEEIEVFRIKKGESPKKILPDSSGCFTFLTGASSIRLVVKSAYYHTDTIVRQFDERRTFEIVSLKTNDYARILHLLSNDKLKEWTERKKGLERMFTDNAKIYQLMENGNYALAIYNKEEFIRKLMLPSGSLKRLDVLETSYEGDQISVLRFKIGKK